MLTVDQEKRTKELEAFLPPLIGEAMSRIREEALGLWETEPAIGLSFASTLAEGIRKTALLQSVYKKGKIMNYIDYDELDLLEFFEMEPIHKDEDDLYYLYSVIGKNKIKIIFSFSVYENKSTVSLLLEDREISHLQLKNIESIKLNDDILEIKMQKERKVKIFKREGFCVLIDFELD